MKANQLAVMANTCAKAQIRHFVVGDHNAFNRTQKRQLEKDRRRAETRDRMDEARKLRATIGQQP